jgi:vacuolar-type H+-ATPase subunit I/STV1
MHILDYYLLGTFGFGLLLSTLTAWLVWRIRDKQIERSYIEYNMPAEALKSIATEAIYQKASAIIMPPMTTYIKGRERIIEVAFVDQKLRLEEIYAQSNTLDIDEGEEDDDYGVYI